MRLDDRRDDRRRDDRRDDRYRPRPPAESGGGNSTLLILGIIGGVLSVVVLVCGGFGFYVFYSAKQGAARVEQDFAKVADKQGDAFLRQQEQMNKWMEEERKKQDERMAKEEAERKEQLDKLQKERDDKLAAKRQAMQLANSFLADTKEGRAADADAMTSAAYRKRVSQEQLADLIREHVAGLRATRTYRELHHSLEHDLDPPFIFRDRSLAKGGFTTIELTIVKEGDHWKVDRCFVARD